MKLLTAVGLTLAFLIGAISIDASTAQSTRCATGHVRGFAVVRGDPRLGGVGAIPNQFTGDPVYFEIRYNCTGKGVIARRVDEGVYDVIFRDNPGKVAVVSALSQNGTVASVDHLTDGAYRVTLRGPLVSEGGDILIRRENPFYIVVF
jgi:hypothetical protein